MLLLIGDDRIRQEIALYNLKPKFLRPDLRIRHRVKATSGQPMAEKSLNALEKQHQRAKKYKCRIKKLFS